jgi:nucleoside-diphosphate-sugar epimerase
MTRRDAGLSHRRVRNIGRNAIPRLLERGHRVRALSHDPRRDRRIAARFGDTIEPALAESVNVSGTRTVLDAARASPRPPRFLFASTVDVYGIPAVQPAGDVVPEALDALGQGPICVPSAANRMTYAFVKHGLSTKAAVRLVSWTTRRMYRR